MRQGRYVFLLRHGSETGCDDRNAEMGFLEASAYFELDDFPNALEAINRALQAQAAAGNIIPETWRSLHAAAREATVPDEILCVTERTVASNIPMEQCYSVEEFREIERLGKINPCSVTARSRRLGVPTIECSGF